MIGFIVVFSVSAGARLVWLPDTGGPAGLVSRLVPTLAGNDGADHA
jgi:hypothetical protein